MNTPSPELAKACAGICLPSDPDDMPEFCPSRPVTRLKGPGVNPEKRALLVLSRFDFLKSRAGVKDDCPLLDLAIPTKSYVYFLLKWGHVVYVGMSRNLLSRLADHDQHGGYPRTWDRVRYAEVPDDLVEWVEQELIHRLRPPKNYVGVGELFSHRRKVFGESIPACLPVPARGKPWQPSPAPSPEARAAQ